MVVCYILLGGMLGLDGYIDSAGMLLLAGRIRDVSHGVVYSCDWANWREVVNMIAHQQENTKTVLIGYSGGGSRACYVANIVKRPIDLMILYDPSPPWQMQAVGDNVRKAVCYHNIRPLMFGFGGGALHGPNVENVEISEQHMLVQADENLHQRTLALITDLVQS